MTSLLAKLPDWLRNGLLVVLGGLIGWFGNQYMEARSAYKEALSANYEKFNEAVSGLEGSLREFAAIAQGAKPKTEEATEKLQTKLLDVLMVAEDLNRRLGDDPAVIEPFRQATVKLKHASDDITGPLNGKGMVGAVNDYAVAEMVLRDRVIKEHNAIIARWLI